MDLDVVCVLPASVFTPSTSPRRRRVDDRHELVDAVARQRAAAVSTRISSQVCQSKTDYDALYDFINNNSGFKTINLQNAETLKGGSVCMTRRTVADAEAWGCGTRSTPSSKPPCHHGDPVRAPPDPQHVLGDSSMESNIQRFEPLLTGPQGYLALSATQEGPNPKVQIVSRFQAYVSRYGNKDTTTATTRRQYSSQKLPALDDGNTDDKARLELMSRRRNEL